MMFDGSKDKPWFERSTIKIGEGLFKMHKVEVSYELADASKNNAIVLAAASFIKSEYGKEVGLLKWDNSKGTAVGDTDQSIVINVKIKNTWNNDPALTSEQVKEITVKVKKADTQYTAPKFLGSLDKPEGLGSYEDLK